jgi:hypothetical protein
MPWFTVKTWWGDQTQQGGGGGSGEDQVRDLVTTKAMIGGDTGSQSGAAPLGIDQATLDYYTEGTRLEGRATVDYSLYGNEEGILGITHSDGSVGINPEAFASGDVLQVVVTHEDVHVGQVMSGNFYSYSSENWKAARAVNEVQACRQGVSVAFQLYADNPDFADFLDGQLGYLDANISRLEGTSYYGQVTTWPYNYTLDPGDHQ